MLIGKFKIEGRVVHTHQASYFLDSVTNLVAPRVFLGTGLMIATASGGFAWSFWDILWPGEPAALVAVSALALVAGLSIRRLEFISRDLAHAQKSCVIYGTAGHVNRLRFEIASAQHAHPAKAEKHDG